ncbi:MAG: hypothetical protein AAGA56_30905 [Myxococcota bacterium]
MAIVVGGGLAAYWWFTQGRHGGAAGYLNHKLGLSADERIEAMWTSYYDPDLSLLESTVLRGANYIVALTSTRVLAIGNNEKGQAPVRFGLGEVRVELYRAHASRLVGPTSTLEPADVIQLTPTSGTAPFRLLLPRSGAQAVIAWSRSAR